MKILLTGATGFIGSFLAESLLNRGYEVRCLVRSTSNLRWIADLDVECFYGSLNDRKALGDAIKDVDYVYHIAGVTKADSEEKFYRGNYEGTKNLIDAVINSKHKIKRFLMVSSQAACGPSPTISPVNESIDPVPITFYGRSKLAAERYVMGLSKKVPVTIVRPPVVYGPRDTDVLEMFKTAKMRLIPQLGGREKYFSLIYAKDLVNGIILAAENKKSAGKIYFLANSKPVSADEFARIILDLLGKRGIRVSIPMPLMKLIATVSETYAKFSGKDTIINRQKILEMEPDFWVCSAKKAKEDFGFEAETSLEDGIRETLSWYVRNNWL
ncbi:MAG: NAD-dependent epimerase/dehydratase family protein [Calditrichaceae bacterium]